MPLLPHPPRPEVTRTSRLAIGAFCGALAVPMTFGSIAIAIGLMAGVPLVGFILVLVALPGIGLLLLFSSGTVYALAVAAEARVRARPDLRGITLTVFARSASMVNIWAGMVLLIAYVAIPTAVAWSESSAWRTTVTQSVRSMHESAGLLAEAADNLNKTAATLPTMGEQAKDLISSLQGQSISINATMATVQQNSQALSNEKESFSSMLVGVPHLFFKPTVPTEDPIVGVWKVENPVIHYKYQNADGSPQNQYSIKDNPPVTGPYAFQFNADHTALIKLRPQGSDELLGCRWQRVSDNTILLKLNQTNQNIEALIQGSTLQIQGLDCYAEWKDSMVCERVDSMPVVP